MKIKETWQVTFTAEVERDLGDKAPPTSFETCEKLLKSIFKGYVYHSMISTVKSSNLELTKLSQ